MTNSDQKCYILRGICLIGVSVKIELALFSVIWSVRVTFFRPEKGRRLDQSVEVLFLSLLSTQGCETDDKKGQQSVFAEQDTKTSWNSETIGFQVSMINRKFHARVEPPGMFLAFLSRVC